MRVPALLLASATAFGSLVGAAPPLLPPGPQTELHSAPDDARRIDGLLSDGEKKLYTEAVVAAAAAQGRFDKETAAARADREREKQQLIVGWVTSGLVIVVVFASVLLNRLRLIRQQKRTIEAQKERMEKELVDDVRESQGDAEQADDVTVMAVSYSGRSVKTRSDALELKVTNRLEEIDRVNKRFNDFARQQGVPEADRRRLNLVFDELLNNIISYGFEDETEHQIAIEVVVTGARLQVTITDDGRPFNPFRQVTPPYAELSIDERPIGGLGVHLVRNVMDSVSYERHSGSNVVTLEKNLLNERRQRATP